MKFTLATGLACLLTANVALAADCSAQLPAWLEQAYPGQEGGAWLEDGRGAYRVDAGQSVCKVWPARPQLTLIAVPLVREAQRDYGQTDLEILVLDNVRQAIVARLIEPHLLDWDAIYVAGLAFDTAPYRLRGDDLAFGLRISRENSSRANSFSETQLHLYELQAQGVRPLLAELPVYRYWSEWDTTCAGDFSETKGVVIITEQPGHDGYRTLLLKLTDTGRGTAEVAGECQTVEQSSQRSQFSIEYGEDRYLLPIELVADPL